MTHYLPLVHIQVKWLVSLISKVPQLSPRHQAEQVLLSSVLNGKNSKLTLVCDIPIVRDVSTYQVMSVLRNQMSRTRIRIDAQADGYINKRKVRKADGQTENVIYIYP